MGQTIVTSSLGGLKIRLQDGRSKFFRHRNVWIEWKLSSVYPLCKTDYLPDYFSLFLYSYASISNGHTLSSLFTLLALSAPRSACFHYYPPCSDIPPCYMHNHLACCMPHVYCGVHCLNAGCACYVAVQDLFNSCPSFIFSFSIPLSNSFERWLLICQTQVFLGL